MIDPTDFWDALESLLEATERVAIAAGSGDFQAYREARIAARDAERKVWSLVKPHLAPCKPSWERKPKS